MLAPIAVVAVLTGTSYQQGVFDDLLVLAGTVGLFWRVFVEPIIVPLAALVGILGAMSACFAELSGAFSGKGVSNDI